MKKLIRCIAAILCISAVLIFSGCYAAYEKTYLSITDVNGGGTRRIDCFFIADGFVHPDSPAGGTHNNDTYFPKGVDEAVAWLQSKVDAEAYKISLNDTEDGFHVVSVEFSFSDIDDYNKKISQLASFGGGYSNEIPPAVMTVTAEGQNFVALWQEDGSVAHNATAWMYRALINEGSEAGVFDGGNVNYNESATRAAGNAQDTVVLAGDTVYCVTLGDATTIFNVQESVYATGNFANDGSYKGELAEKLPEKATADATDKTVDTAKDNSNGKTVLWIVIVGAILLIMLACFAAMYISVRRSRLK